MAKESKPTREVRQHAPAVKDKRFARLQTDPRFLKPIRDEAKVVVDDRFKGLLSGGLSAGGRQTKIDKYGRKVKNKAVVENGNKDEMNRLYRLEDEDQAEPSNSDSTSSSEEEDDNDGGKEKKFIDYARGEGQLDSSDEETSSEEDGESGEQSGEEGVIVMGNAAARRRENQSLRFADEEDEEDEEEEEKDFANGELQVGEEDLSKLDAQAERTVRREAAAAKRTAGSMPKRIGDTSRLAVVNMDWDHIRAIDLYKVFSSLVSPAGSTVAGPSNGTATRRNATSSSSYIMPVKGRVLNVRVYPSSFGLERMARENREGPPKDIFKRDEQGRIKPKKKAKSKKGSNNQNEPESDDSDIELFEVDEGGEFDEEALRNYQLERLRYFYAIVTFDSPQAARYIMDEVDGTEMERTANVFDLSFVPDDMTFPEKEANKEDLADEGWRDEASEIHDGGAYKGVDFTTDALRHSKVQLTWDADDPQRSKVTREFAQQALTVDQIRDEDFKSYLASDSDGFDEEENEEEGGIRDKMRALLGLDEQIDEDQGASFGKSKSKAFEDGRKSRGEDGAKEMQITFMPGLSEAAERRRSGAVAEAKEESTRDKYLRKQKERKEKKRLQGRGEEEEKAPEMEATGKIGFDDPFFASDNEDDFEKALAAEQEGRKEELASKKSKVETKQSKVSRQEEAPTNELQDEAESEDEGGHFNIKDVLKAEQAENGKKSRWAKKKEKSSKAKDDEREHQVQENFAIDVDDERFQGVFYDYRFSLDPSHPSFIKTKNMEKLLDERRKRDKQQRKNGSKSIRVDSKPHSTNGNSDLDDLVKSVKKRSAIEGHDSRWKKKRNID